MSAAKIEFDGRQDLRTKVMIALGGFFTEREPEALDSPPPQSAPVNSSHFPSWK